MSIVTLVPLHFDPLHKIDHPKWIKMGIKIMFQIVDNFSRFEIRDKVYQPTSNVEAVLYVEYKRLFV